MPIPRKSLALLSHYSRMSVALFALVLQANCGQPDDNDVGARKHAIRNGDFDLTHRAVAQVTVAGAGGCSGTFIAPRLFLTAAHCLPRCPVGGPLVACHEYPSGGTFIGHDGPVRGDVTVVARFNGCSAWEQANDPNCQRDVYQADYVFFPKNVNASTSRDVAVLQTTRPYRGDVLPLMEPERLPAPSNINDYIDDAITMVGFSNQMMPDARRRSGAATITSAVRTVGFSANPSSNPAQVVCSGDSGGPSLFDVADDAGYPEKTGGVTSTGNCAELRHAVNASYIPRSLPKRAFAVQHSAYLGCHKDARRRDLTALVGSENHMTPTHCVSMCQARNYNFAGVQFGRYCFCGQDYGDYGKVADSECSTPCTGDGAQTCGGAWRNAVYAVSRGCYKDTSDRDLPHQVAAEWGMTPQRCIGLCAERDYDYAGLQYSYYCFCGDAYGKHGESNRCVAECGGDASESCGGRWANDVFPAQGR